MSLLDAVGAFVGGGGLAAAIGTATSAVTKYKEKKLDNAHELAMTSHRQEEWRFQAEMAKAQAEHDRYLVDGQLLIESQRGADALTESAIDADGAEVVAALKMSGMPWQVGAMRTLFRPFLTLFLWTILLIVWWRVPMASELNVLVVQGVVQGAMMSLGVWFGGRIIK